MQFYDVKENNSVHCILFLNNYKNIEQVHKSQEVNYENIDRVGAS